MAGEKQPHTKGSNWDISLKIANVDLAKFIRNMRLTNTMNSIYPIFTFDISMDSFNIISYEIFGQEPIQVNMILVGEDQQPTETITFKLIYLNSQMPLVPKPMQGGTDHQDYSPMTFHCIVLPCYKLMATGVNAIFEEPAALTPLQCVRETLKRSGISSTYLAIDERGMNPSIINQIIIPPMSVVRHINYIHELYGLYFGPLFRFCGIDPATGNPILYIEDLSQKITNDNPSIIIYQMPVNDKSGLRETIMNKCTDNKHFFTESPIITENYSNSNLISFRYNRVQILHPDDTLYSIQNITMDDVVKKTGTSQKKQLNYLSELKDIETKYCTDLKGFAYEDGSYSTAALSSRSADQIKNTFQIGITLKHNLVLTNLIRIGSVVEFKASVLDYMKYSGNYILKSSDIQWNKLGDQWETSCNLTMFRSSRDM